MHGLAIDVKSPAVAMSSLEGEGGTQMRRTRKEDAYVRRGDGGLPSKIHAPAESGAGNLAAVRRTTAPLRTTVAGVTIFLETLTRSTVTQFLSHDCDIDTALITSIPG